MISTVSVSLYPGTLSDYRLRRHDGVFRWIFDRGVPFTDDAGSFAGSSGAASMSTSAAGLRTPSSSDQQQLALARDFEKWILAIVSHDIRDPLTILFAARRLEDLADAGSAETNA